MRRLLPPGLQFAEGDPTELLEEFFSVPGENAWDLQEDGERIITGH